MPLGDTERQEWMDWLLGGSTGDQLGLQFAEFSQEVGALSSLPVWLVHVNDFINSLCEIMYILKRGKERKDRWNGAVLNPNEVVRGSYLRPGSTTMDFPASQGQKVSLRVAVTLECACVCCQMRIQAGGCPGFLPDAAGTAEIGEVSGSLATAFLLSLVSQSWSSKLSPTPPHSHSPTLPQLPTALGVFTR